MNTESVAVLLAEGRLILYLRWHPVLGHVNQFVSKMLAKDDD